jgi:putative protease
MGVKRAVLARELDLAGISGIKSKLNDSGLDCAVEAFIHGAMCVSISGRCFLSQYTFNKSANRGQCLQPCRREYYISDSDNESEYILGKDYLLSPKDLCTVDFIDRLIASDIDAFKIEGRMRPPEYVKVVTAVYRTAIDEYFEGKLTETRKTELKTKLNYSFNRGFDSGFYFGRPEQMGGEVKKDYKKTYLGQVRKYYDKIGVCEVWLQTAGLKKGQKVVFYGDKTPAEFVIVGQMQIEHEPVDMAAKGAFVAIKVPFKVRKNDKIFIWEEEASQRNFKE